MFTTTTRAKDLNGLQFQLYLSYNRYEKMTKLTNVTTRIVEENSFRLITMRIVCNLVYSYYSHFLSFNIVNHFSCKRSNIKQQKLKIIKGLTILKSQ